MITGSVDAIMAVLDFIMDRIREKPDISKQQQQQQNATLQQQQQLSGAGDASNGIAGNSIHIQFYTKHYVMKKFLFVLYF